MRNARLALLTAVCLAAYFAAPPQGGAAQVDSGPLYFPLVLYFGSPPTLEPLPTRTIGPGPTDPPPTSVDTPGTPATPATPATPTATPRPATWTPTRIFGQRDFTQTAYNQVVPNRLFHPGGVVVDRMPAGTPSRIYIWDAGNNRMLGLEHAGTCEGGSSAGAACTENSGCAGGTCSGNTDRAADLVFGQPSGAGHAACNHDNTRLAPAGPDTLCAVPFPEQISIAEGPRGNSLAVDNAHGVYVVDPFNNRVLRFDDPFGTALSDPDAATRADAVWGQPDFVSRRCNQGRDAPGPDTLCTGEVDRFYPNYYFSAGLDVTPDGQHLWVADLGNHRVLRIPTDGSAADLVIGQPNFSTRIAHCTPPYDTAFLCKPNAVRYDPALDRLYVLDGDGANARVIVWDSPSENGQVATRVYEPPPGGLFWARGLTLDPLTEDALWVSDGDHSRIIQYVGGEPRRVLGQADLEIVGCRDSLGDGPLPTRACSTYGSVGIDRDGSVYVMNLYDQNVVRFPAPIPEPRADGVARSADAALLPPPVTYGPWLMHANRLGAFGLANPGALTLVDDQLVIADRKRLLVWRGYADGIDAPDASPAAGDADAVLAQSSFERQDSPPGPVGGDFVALTHDTERELLYAAHLDGIMVWRTDGGLSTRAEPDFRIGATFALRGGGSTVVQVVGIALDIERDVAWLSDGRKNRIVRVLGFSTSEREIDVVLGQDDVESGECNRGRLRSNPSADSFCIPTQVRFDQHGDLYVVDGHWEGQGNQRVVAYAAADLPPIPSPQLTWPTGEIEAVRVYGKASFHTVACSPSVEEEPCTPRFISFEPVTNRMLLSADGYGNPQHYRLFLYDDPAPEGVSAVPPSGVVPLPFAQAADSAWDEAGRVVILDHTWNRAVLIARPPGVER